MSWGDYSTIEMSYQINRIYEAYFTKTSITNNMKSETILYIMMKAIHCRYITLDDYCDILELLLPLIDKQIFIDGLQDSTFNENRRDYDYISGYFLGSYLKGNKMTKFLARNKLEINIPENKVPYEIINNKTPPPTIILEHELDDYVIAGLARYYPEMYMHIYHGNEGFSDCLKNPYYVNITTLN